LSRTNRAGVSAGVSGLVWVAVQSAYRNAGRSGSHPFQRRTALSWVPDFKFITTETCNNKKSDDPENHRSL